jgi:hypothetical protein
MPSEPIAPSDPSPRLQEMKAKKLWFGLAGSVAAWIVLGCADIVIVWRACMRQEDYGVPPVHPGVGALIFGITMLLLAITIGAGVISYRNWKWLSQQRKMLNCEAVPRGEFVAVVGVIVSLTLGLGIFWLALTPWFIELCWRAK